MEECKLGLHKTLTHAETSRVLKASSEERAKPQAAHRLQVNRNQGCSGCLKIRPRRRLVLKSCHRSQEEMRAIHIYRGVKPAPLLLQGRLVQAFWLYSLERTRLSCSKYKPSSFFSLPTPFFFFFLATVYNIEKYVMQMLKGFAFCWHV